jgi:hypothetical protein
MIKIWTEQQVDFLEENQLIYNGKIPEEVILALRNTVSILDEAYGRDRDPDQDLGGYACIIDDKVIGECKEYQDLLIKYGLSEDIAEFTDPIMTKDNGLENNRYQWYMRLFVLSSDYSIMIIYKDLI